MIATPVELIETFETLVTTLPKHVASTEKLGPYAYAIKPAGHDGEPWQGKDFALTIMGITHGSEIAGVAILNELLSSLQKDVLKLEIPLVLILGNVDAAKKGERYLESDLNRSFLRDTAETAEHRRAKELEPIIARTRYLVDLHQTRLASEVPFFIFPFTRAGFTFARQISGSTPIVTHWGRQFSKDGRCTDDFCNTQGGTGISIELGQNGLHPYRVASGYKHVVHALEAVTQLARGEEVGPATSNEIYTWAQVIDYPQDGAAELKPGFVNFSEVKAGESLGTKSNQAIVAQQDGRILFPYYPGPDVKRAPAELCRVMKKISESELPD